MKRIWFWAALFVHPLSGVGGGEQITPHLEFQSGAVNGVSIAHGGKRLAVYGWSDAAAGLVDVFEETRRAAHGRSRAA